MVNAFDDLWKLYPSRRGSNPKKPAMQAFNARIEEGVTFDELRKAVTNYRRHVAENRMIGTPYVMQARTFFGPNERWQEWATKTPNYDEPGRRRLRGDA